MERYDILGLLVVLSFISIVQLLLWTSRKAHNYMVAYLQLRLKKTKEEFFAAGVRWGEKALALDEPKDLETYLDWTSGRVFVTSAEVQDLLAIENIKASLSKRRENMMHRYMLTFKRWGDLF